MTWERLLAELDINALINGVLKVGVPGTVCIILALKWDGRLPFMRKYTKDDPHEPHK